METNYWSRLTDTRIGRRRLMAAGAGASAAAMLLAACGGGGSDLSGKQADKSSLVAKAEDST
jgi:hypothetical protein